jgi:hypothetical protein
MSLRLAVAFSLVTALALAGMSVAQSAQRLSYEQAWAQCKKEIAAQGGPMSENAGSSGRYAAGGACLKRYGYRLKKKSSF